MIYIQILLLIKDLSSITKKGEIEESRPAIMC